MEAGMAKPNYNHAKRQKEAARKARQEARLARRQARPAPEPATGESAGGGDAVPPPETKT
jgi:hypothetical protein